MTLRLKYAKDAPRRRPIRDDVHTGFIGVKGEWRVYLVDGEKVRNEIDVDFTMGGNFARYSYVPEGEIWLDEALNDFDRRATLAHELHETRLMLDGMSYDKAHDKSSAIERKWRREHRG